MEQKSRTASGSARPEQSPLPTAVSADSQTASGDSTTCGVESTGGTDCGSKGHAVATRFAAAPRPANATRGGSVQRAQFVDDRALDAGQRVDFELQLAGLEALYGRGEADEAVGDEVGVLDVSGRPRRQALVDVLDQGRVGEDEELASSLIAACLVAAPQIPYLYPR